MFDTSRARDSRHDNEGTDRDTSAVMEIMTQFVTATRSSLWLTDTCEVHIGPNSSQSIASYATASVVAEHWSLCTPVISEAP